MEYSKFTYNELFDKANSSALVLPNFQRDFVWKIDAQKQLLASFIVNLPIGTFLILEGIGGEFVSKKLCFNKKVKTQSSCYYLLDGQQRLSTIKNIFSDHLGVLNWKSNYDDLHYQLQYKWFLKVSAEKEEDILGYSNMRFDVKNEIKPGVFKNVPKLMTLEPSDVLSCISSYKVFKSNKTEFYHPSKGKEFGEFQQKLEYAIAFAQKKIIPMFDMLSEDQIIVKETLKILADHKVKELQNLVGNDSKLSIEYLSHLDSNIQKKYDTGKYDQITRLWSTLKEQWVEKLLEYFRDLFKSEILIPTVKYNELARATSVFEYMNKGGTPLDTFDIIVAKYADVEMEKTLYDILKNCLEDSIKIHDILSNSSESILYSPDKFDTIKNDTISKSIKEQFLNLLSVNNVIKKNGLSKLALGDVKRDVILNLKKDDIDDNLELTLTGIARGLAFLQFRCGIESFNKLSYKLMVLPICVALQDDTTWEDRHKLNKIEYWYWTALFSGRYREKQNQRSIDDIIKLVTWIKEGNSDIPEMEEKMFSETNYSDLTTLLLENQDRSTPKAIHNGILQYVLSRKPNDFSEDRQMLCAWEIASDKVTLQDHHIIPLGSVTTLGQSSKELRSDKQHILNSPLNRTLITAKSNNKIKSMDLRRYLPLLHKSVEFTQCIPNVSIDDLVGKKEDFYKEFLTKRFELIKRTLNQELRELIQ